MFAPLYISRRVLDTAPLDRLVASLGFEPRDSYHATMIYSINAVDWTRPDFMCQDDPMTLHLINPRLDLFGPEKNILVMRFESEVLHARMQGLCAAGAKTVHSTLIPHITLTRGTHEALPDMTGLEFPTHLSLSGEVRRKAAVFVMHNKPESVGAQLAELCKGESAPEEPRNFKSVPFDLNETEWPS